MPTVAARESYFEAIDVIGNAMLDDLEAGRCADATVT
jgi:hypothetical protein